MKKKGRKEMNRESGRIVALTLLKKSTRLPKMVIYQRGLRRMILAYL